MRNLLSCLIAALIVAGCSAAQSTRPTHTPLPLPSPTPFVVIKKTATAPGVPAASPVSQPTSTSTPEPTATQTSAPSVKSRPQGTPVPSGSLSRADAPAAIASALQAAGITSRVYWFDYGGEEMLMISYDSPIRFRPGYEERLQAVKEIVAPFFLRIDPLLYTLYIAATDLTGTSDTVLRLDRYTVERWSRGEIGDADFYNNGFVPAVVVLTCTADGCTAQKPTPFPTFPSFPFPFPTPTFSPRATSGSPGPEPPRTLPTLASPLPTLVSPLPTPIP